MGMPGTRAGILGTRAGLCPGNGPNVSSSTPWQLSDLFRIELFEEGSRFGDFFCDFSIDCRRLSFSNCSHSAAICRSLAGEIPEGKLICYTREFVLCSRVKYCI